MGRGITASVCLLYLCGGCRKYCHYRTWHAGGNGAFWWEAFRKEALSYPRPKLVSFDHCRHVQIAGIKLLNSPSWTVHPVCCENVTIHGLTIINPADSPNTDGLTPSPAEMYGFRTAILMSGMIASPSRQEPRIQRSISHAKI